MPRKRCTTSRNPSTITSARLLSWAMCRRMKRSMAAPAATDAAATTKVKNGVMEQQVVGPAPRPLETKRGRTAAEVAHPALRDSLLCRRFPIGRLPKVWEYKRTRPARRLEALRYSRLSRRAGCATFSAEKFAASPKLKPAGVGIHFDEQPLLRALAATDFSVAPLIPILH